MIAKANGKHNHMPVRIVKRPEYDAEGLALRDIFKGVLRSGNGGLYVHLTSPERPDGFATMMHNAAYDRLGLASRSIQLEAGSIKDALCWLQRHKVVSGASIDEPHKIEAVRLLKPDEISDSAKAIGAVDTIIRHNGVLHGYNYSYVSALRAIRKKFVISRNTKAIVIGASATGKAIAYGLRKRGVEVIGVSARVPPKLRGSEFDIVVCALTPKQWGLAAKISGQVTCRGIVVDASGFHRLNVFLDRARELGLQTVTNKELLLHQSMIQVEKFSGTVAPINSMRIKLADEIRN